MLSAHALADNGASRTRPRRTLGRCKRLAEGGLLDDEEVEQGTAAPGSRRRRVPDEVLLAARIERLASKGSIRRAAAALDNAPLAETSDAVVIAKLRALHPEAVPPTTLSTDVPAIQITEKTLVAVERRLSATSKGKGETSHGLLDHSRSTETTRVSGDVLRDAVRGSHCMTCLLYTSPSPRD